MISDEVMVVLKKYILRWGPDVFQSGLELAICL